MSGNEVKGSGRIIHLSVMLLKYFQKNKKRIFLVAGSEEDLAGLKASLNLYCKGLIIAGKAVLPDDINLAESVINESTV